MHCLPSVELGTAFYPEPVDDCDGAGEGEGGADSDCPGWREEEKIYQEDH